MGHRADPVGGLTQWGVDPSRCAQTKIKGSKARRMKEVGEVNPITIAETVVSERKSNKG